MEPRNAVDKKHAGLLAFLGSQGTATLAIVHEMLQTLIAKGVLQRTEVIAMLNAAAEAVERQTGKLGGMEAKSTGAAIHAILATFLDAPDVEQKH